MAWPYNNLKLTWVSITHKNSACTILALMMGRVRNAGLYLCEGRVSHAIMVRREPQNPQGDATLTIFSKYDFY
jgi:hypothetical protein